MTTSIDRVWNPLWIGPSVVAMTSCSAPPAPSAPTSDPAPPGSRPASVPNQENGAAIWPLLLVTTLGTVVFGLGNVIVPAVRISFGASAGAASLVLGMFTAVFAALVLPGGRWGDHYGRRRVLTIGIVVLVLAGAVTVLAPSLGVLLAARAVQGIGFGLALPQVLATINAALSGERRRQAVFGYATAGGVGTTLGLLVSGVLVTLGGASGWRWALALVVVVGLVALAGIRAVPATGRADGGRVDVCGSILIAICLLCLVGGLSLGPTLGWWPLPVLLFVVAAAGAVVCAWWQRRLEASAAHQTAGTAVAPLLPPSVLAVPALRLGLLMAGVFFLGYGAFLYDYSTLTQDGFGLPTWVTSVAAVPFSLGYVTSSLFTSRIVHAWGDRTMGRAALLQIAALAGVIVSGAFAPSGVVWLLAVQLPMVLLGVAQAWQFGPLVGTVIEQVPARVAGLTGGLVSMVQQAALAIGVASIGSLFGVVLQVLPPVIAFDVTLGLQMVCVVVFILAARRLRRM